MKGKSFSISIAEIIFFTFLFMFSWILMWKTFRLHLGNIEIASRAWSDFAATIPLIRSFSLGENFPPQYPIFAGPPIRYHFVFYFLVGNLEKVGIPLDWALNSLSIIGFFGLLVTIYYMGKIIFKSETTGILSTIFFLFNGSLGFLEFFRQHSFSFNILSDIIHNTSFSSFGPYDGKIVSAFWSLNIFTNQRHLAMAYAVFLLIFLPLYSWAEHPAKFSNLRVVLIGIIVGIFPFIHLAVFGMLGILLIVTLLIFPSIRIKIFIAGLIALILAVPQILFMGKSEVSTSLIHWWYLADNTSIMEVAKYWLYNLGLTALLAPLGLYISSTRQKKFIIPFICLFVVGNAIQFSPEVAANHKFFNLAVIGFNFFTAYFLITLLKNHISGKIVAVILIPFLILTGVIDYFPIINDTFFRVRDVPINPTANFIYESTPKEAVFLNSSYLYHPANIAGRKIFMGWPYFPWSAGYATDTRSETMNLLLSGTLPIDEECHLLRSHGIDYIDIQTPNQLEGIIIDYQYFNYNFLAVYQNSIENSNIYDVTQSCSKL